MISWLAVWGWMPLAGSRLAFLGTTTGAVLATVLAAGELIADKLPGTPARTKPGPFAARLITGAFAGAAVCLAAGQPWILGAAAGAAGAAAGTIIGYRVRQALVRRAGLPDLAVALAEDLVAIAGTLALLAQFYSKAV